jgi:signal transduction histidine kinase
VKPQVRVWAESIPDNMVRISFEDNGIGIRKEAQERIFMMFQRLNSPGEYEGTGIGLAIVRKAVERMGGKVGVESEPGKGGRFWIDLRRQLAAPGLAG